MPVVIPEPGALVIVLLMAAVYLRGVRAVWARAGQGRGVRNWQAAAFVTGLLVLVAALETPLDRLSQALFSAHMVQHLLLMLVAAPLLAPGAPLIALAWGLPADLRRGTARLCRLVPSRPSMAFALHVVAIWAWHIPGLYEAALANRAIHAAEHASFLATGALFWWALLHARRPRLARLAASGSKASTSVDVSMRRGEHAPDGLAVRSGASAQPGEDAPDGLTVRTGVSAEHGMRAPGGLAVRSGVSAPHAERAGYGLGVLYVFGMALQSTLLGALLTFARAPWYSSHLGSTVAWGLTALEDQQLAGVIMWVPGGLIYLVAALALFGVWLSAGAGPAPGPSTPARRSAGQLASPEP